MIVQEIFNTTAVRDVELEILNLQLDNERKHYDGPEGFAEGEESVPTFYLQRKKEKPYHLDRTLSGGARQAPPRS